jgi:CO/xanthine dehydrogenase Mo-binding subunit
MLDATLSPRIPEAGGALVVTFTLAPRSARRSPRALDKSVNADDVGAFHRDRRQGHVTLYSGKVELGTGALTALTQMAAEELSVPFARVTTIQGDTRSRPNQGRRMPAFRSRTAACRSARGGDCARGLLDEAARKLGVAKAELAVRDGIVSLRDGSKSFRTPSSWAIAAHDQGEPAAPLKDPKDYTIVGKPCRDSTFRRRSSGPFDFVQDVKVPGMLHARVVHPAGVRSTLQSFDDTACRKIKGYVRAVRKGDFLAVVATNEWAAISASTAIVASGRTGPACRRVAALRVRAQLEGRPQRSIPEPGNTAEALKAGGRTLQATYDLAMNTHGSIGPSCAVADFKNGR